MTTPSGLKPTAIRCTAESEEQETPVVVTLEVHENAAADEEADVLLTDFFTCLGEDPTFAPRTTHTYMARRMDDYHAGSWNCLPMGAR